MKAKKLISAAAALTIVFGSITSMLCSAAPEAATTMPAVSGAADERTAKAETTEKTTVDWNALKEKYIEEVNEDAKKDYYSDPYYDTEGNASLIDSKGYKVIYSSDELLFTSVTTKDGHVFYILVDYSDKDGDNNVYFLNKVDDYDLYALLNSEKSDSEDGSLIEQYEKQTTAAIQKKTSVVETTALDDNEKKSDTAATGVLNLKTIILAGVGLLLVISAFIIPKFLGKKKKQPKFEDDELEEINEDDD